MDHERARAAKAVEYLVETAAEIAAAKAELTKREHMLKVVKAMVMRQSNAKSAAAQEVEALSSPAYLTALTELEAAERAFQELRAMREAAVARIDFWRSMNANQRAAERGFGSAA